jgi:hypothetical protein
MFFVLEEQKDIEEADIPMLETQYELPENLVGDFIVVNDFIRTKRGIKIFPNNKFITWRLVISDNGRIDRFSLSWRRFFERVDKTLDEMHRIIRFTNGVPYYSINDGTALLEI